MTDDEVEKNDSREYSKDTTRSVEVWATPEQRPNIVYR